MRLIVLDIDGVIATDRTYAAWRRAGSGRRFVDMVHLLDRDLAAAVNQAALDAGAGVVVSSTWRHHDKCPYDINDVLQAAGITAPIVGKTPTVVPPPAFARKQRGYEINAYLFTAGASLDDVVILDDDAGAPCAPPDATIRHGARVIRTDEKLGITPKQVVRLRAMLGLS